MVKLFLFPILALPAVAHADQFLLTDVTYTHSVETTRDSHYRVSPLPGTPRNWRSPVDYTRGTIQVTAEVLTKPSNADTVLWICFEATPTYDCTIGPVYKTPKVMTWTDKGMLGRTNRIDWTRGVGKVAMILKDKAGKKVAPESVGADYAAQFMPTMLRVTITVSSAGDGGVVARDASAAPDARPDVRLDVAPNARPDAAAREAAAAVEAGLSEPDPELPTGTAPTSTASSGGCSMARGPSGGLGVLLALLILLRSRGRLHGQRTVQGGRQ